MTWLRLLLVLAVFGFTVSAAGAQCPTHPPDAPTPGVVGRVLSNLFLPQEADATCCSLPGLDCRTPNTTPGATPCPTGTPVEGSSCLGPNDGGTLFTGTGTVGTSAAYYIGPSLVATSQGEGTFWSTAQAFTSCTATITVSTPPGAGTTHTFALLTESTGFGATGTNSCSDNAGNMESTALCSISGASDKSCTATVSPTIAANTCLSVKHTHTGSVASATAVVSVKCTDTNGDGVIALTSGDGASLTSTTYLGASYSGSTTNYSVNWPLGKAISSCAGRLSVDTAPSPGTWTVAVKTSTAALTAGQSCENLSYSVSGTAVCTITGTDQTCAFPQTAVTAPAGYCIGMAMTASGSPTTSAGENWALDCTSDTTAPYRLGGATWANFKAGAGTTTYFVGTGHAATNTVENAFAVNAGGALTTCSGAVAHTLATASESWTVKGRYSTTALGATQGCADLTYSAPVTLCTMTTGTGKNCTWTDQAFPVPANGCWQIEVTASNPGSMTSPSASWSMSCRES